MVKGIADIFVSSGLKDAGYEYVNLDDCWALPERDADGNLVPDPVRFPNGIKAVADYVHAKGLKFGIYTSAGTKTCSPIGFPGALGHEEQDAALFASLGRRLPEVRQLQQPGRGRGRALHDDAGRAADDRPPDRLQHLRVGPEQALGLGQGRRPSLAHDRRHHRQLGEPAEAHQAEHGARAVRRARATGTTPTCSRSATAA